MLFCLFLKTVEFCFQITQPCTSNQQDSENKTQSDETNINYVNEKIKNEIKSLSSKDSKSILRGKDDESLALLSWTKLAAELKEKTPTFWTILEACSHNPRQMNTNIRKTKDANVPSIVRVTGRFAHFPVRPESFRPKSFRPRVVSPTIW